MCIADEGRYAITHYETLKTWHYFALLKVNLETGRMHQNQSAFGAPKLPGFGGLAIQYQTLCAFYPAPKHEA